MNTTAYVWPEGEELVFVRPPVEEYHGSLDYFYDPKLFPELEPLVKNWEAIRDEILNFEKLNGELKGMSSVNPANVYGGQWTLIYLFSFSRMFHKNRARFPITTSVLDQIPNAVFSAISVLPAGAEITPHYGDTNGIVRSHLALVVPAPHPTIAIKVGDEEMGWKEGEMICFVNVQKHQVWNRSDKRRYVLMVDFVPRILQHRTKEICAKGLGSQSFIFVYKAFPFVKHLPAFVHQLMVHVATAIWWVYLPIQRRLKFL
jgi:beta-hydroxylase